jgi:arylsulfatase A-like enzyme
MNAVKEKGIEENTLIIFSSDNGPDNGNGGDPDFFNSNGGLKGIKRDLYEGGIRVPFIAYQKGLTKAGTVDTMPAALWDLFPTFLQLAGISSTKKTDGISLLPALKGQKQNQHEYFYWEFHDRGGKQAVRYGNWKGVRLNVSTSDNSPIELYDLEVDPQEKNNIASKHPEVVKKIEAFMKEAYVPNPDWPLMAEIKK